MEHVARVAALMVLLSGPLWARQQGSQACGRALLPLSPKEKDRTGDLLGWRRPGAGPAPGWLVEASAKVELDEGPGPLGPGALRLTEGDWSAISPPIFLQPGCEHRICLWTDSEGEDGGDSGIRIHVMDGADHTVAEGNLAVGPDWSSSGFRFTPPPDEAGAYWLELKAWVRQGSLGLDGFSLEESTKRGFPSSPPPSDSQAWLALRSLDPWGLRADSQAWPVDLVLLGDPGSGPRLQVRLVHVDGSYEDLPEILIPPGPVARCRLDLMGSEPTKFGLFRAEAVAVDCRGRRVSNRAEVLLGRVPSPAPGPLVTSPFGIHVLLKEPDLAVARMLGFKWCRIHDASGITKWGIVEPEKDRWVWRDDQVELALKEGFTILGMLDSAPAWLTGAPRDSGYFSIYHAPKDLDAWRSYVSTVVGRYRDSIRHWEVWNEPWGRPPFGYDFFHGGSPELYVDLLKTAYEETKKILPEGTVLGINTAPPMWDHAVLRLGAYGSYDVLSFHWYTSDLLGGPKDAPSQLARGLIDRQSAYGPAKPMWTTEQGPWQLLPGSFLSFARDSTHGDWSLVADQIPRAFLSHLAAGFDKVFLYSMHGFPRLGKPGTWMLTHPGPSLVPAHASLAAFIHFVEGSRYLRCLIPCPGASAHLFQRQGKLLAVLLSDKGDEVQLRQPLPQAAISFDRWGNQTPPLTKAGRGPVYVEVDEYLAAELELALSP